MPRPKIIILFALFATMGVHAQEAGAVVEASDPSFWKMIATFLAGIVGTKVVGWLADLVSGKGSEWIAARLTKLQEKLNENSLLGQIQADDAITRILEDAIPTVFNSLNATVKRDLADGKFDKIEWDGIGAKLWDEVKDQITDGKNDYLANSSFADGKAIATWVVQNWFKKRKTAEELSKPDNI